MRFLANENIPVETVQTLRKEGVDISSVKDLIPGATDEEVLELAVKEERILITFDKDFGEWVFLNRVKRPRGIVLLRINPLSADYITKVLRDLFAKDLSFQNHFVVVSEEKIRVVPL